MPRIELRYMGRFCELAQTPEEEREVDCETFGELMEYLEALYPTFSVQFFNKIGERHECTLRRPWQVTINPELDEKLRDGDRLGFY